MFSEFDLIQKYPFQHPQPVLVDVGAHHGYVSRLFAKQGWRVLAFEPERNNWKSLLNCTADLDNVTCIQKAVSDVSGASVPFYVSREHFGIHSLKPFHRTHTCDYEVETITLNDALQETKVSNVTLLKIDIEGADFLALKGFNLRKFAPEMIMMEFMDDRTKMNFDYTHHDVVSYMNAAGYACLISEWAPIGEYAREGEESTPHKWLGCKRYPLDHEPAWGNLVFVPQQRIEQLQATLESYLHNLRKQRVSSEWYARLRSSVARIPGARNVYRLFVRN